VTEHLLCQHLHEALSSNPIPTKNKKSYLGKKENPRNRSMIKDIQEEYMFSHNNKKIALI
jgi:hypothetical protein